VRVAQNQSAPRADVIDVFVAVGVPEARTGGVVDDDRLAAHCAKCADGTVYAADKHVGGAAKDFLRTGTLHWNEFG